MKLNWIFLFKKKLRRWVYKFNIILRKTKWGAKEKCTSVHAVGSTESKGKKWRSDTCPSSTTFSQYYYYYTNEGNVNYVEKGRTSDFVNHLFGVVLLGCFVSGDYCVALFFLLCCLIRLCLIFWIGVLDMVEISVMCMGLWLGWIWIELLFLCLNYVIRRRVWLYTGSQVLV